MNDRQSKVRDKFAAARKALAAAENDLAALAGQEAKLKDEHAAAMLLIEAEIGNGTPEQRVGALQRRQRVVDDHIGAKSKLAAARTHLNQELVKLRREAAPERERDELFGAADAKLLERHAVATDRLAWATQRREVAVRKGLALLVTDAQAAEAACQRQLADVEREILEV